MALDPNFHERPLKQNLNLVPGLGSVVSHQDAIRVAHFLKTRSACPPEFFDASDLAVTQNHAGYTPQDALCWTRCLNARLADMQKYGAQLLLEGVLSLGITPTKIPEIDSINSKLRPMSGWRLVGVGGLVPPYYFAQMLADEMCPVVVGMRKADTPLTESEPELPTFCSSDVDTDLISGLIAYPGLLADPALRAFLKLWGELSVELYQHEETTDTLPLQDELGGIFRAIINLGILSQQGNFKFFGTLLSTAELPCNLELYNIRELSFDETQIQTVPQRGLPTLLSMRSTEDAFDLLKEWQCDRGLA